MESIQKSGIPGFSHVDHIGLTVPNLDDASKFYCEIFGAKELYRLGPFDAAEIPEMEDGSDWTEAHVNVKGARLTLAMLSISPNMMLELFEYERPVNANKTPPSNADYGGHHIAFKVSDITKASEYLAAKGCKVMPGRIDINEGPSSMARVQYVLDPWGNQLELVEYDKLEWMKNSEYKSYSNK